MTAVHTCVVCRDLPILPFDPADVDLDREYRPKAPRPAPFGGPRSRRCATHERAKIRETKRRGRLTRRATVYGIDAETQQLIWELQGCACPCGRKAAPEPPPGVHMDHDHGLAELHEHPVAQGCRRCVTGFLCQQCNQHIIGRLTRHWSRETVANALARLSGFVADPPMRQIDRDQDLDLPA